MDFREFFESIASPELRAIAEHWETARGGKRLPAWGDIDPVAIGRHLRYVWAWKYDREADSFTGRLAGDDIVRAFGKSPRGLPMTDFFAPAVYLVFFPWHRRVVREPAFMHGAGKVYSQVERNFTGERIMLPLAENGDQGDGILGATLYQAAVSAPAPDRGAADFDNETIAFFPLSSTFS